MTGAARVIERPVENRFSLFRIMQTAAFVAFAAAAIVLAIDIARGAARFGNVWLIPIVVVAAWALADFISGVVHFLADNFGTPETPILGAAFVKPFRDHHTDPKGILENPFLIANGNNCVVSLPPLLMVILLVPVNSTFIGYIFGTFFLAFSIGIFLTNQFHKWAHMESPPRPVAWLQANGLILSNEHHDRHHTSPFDTYYCITTGWWNPLLERVRFFDRSEKIIRGFETPNTKRH